MGREEARHVGGGRQLWWQEMRCTSEGRGSTLRRCGAPGFGSARQAEAEARRVATETRRQRGRRGARTRWRACGRRHARWRAIAVVGRLRHRRACCTRGRPRRRRCRRLALRLAHSCSTRRRWGQTSRKRVGLHSTGCLAGSRSRSSRPRKRSATSNIEATCAVWAFGIAHAEEHHTRQSLRTTKGLVIVQRLCIVGEDQDLAKKLAEGVCICIRICAQAHVCPVTDVGEGDQIRSYRQEPVSRARCAPAALHRGRTRRASFRPRPLSHCCSHPPGPTHRIAIAPKQGRHCT